VWKGCCTNRTAAGRRWAEDGRMASLGFDDAGSFAKHAAAIQAAAPPASAAGSVRARSHLSFREDQRVEFCADQYHDRDQVEPYQQHDHRG